VRISLQRNFSTTDFSATAWSFDERFVFYESTASGILISL